MLNYKEFVIPRFTLIHYPFTSYCQFKDDVFKISKPFL